MDGLCNSADVKPFGLEEYLGSGGYHRRRGTCLQGSRLYIAAVKEEWTSSASDAITLRDEQHDSEKNPGGSHVVCEIDHRHVLWQVVGGLLQDTDNTLDFVLNPGSWADKQ